jgi:hypothetical protein
MSEVLKSIPSYLVGSGARAAAAAVQAVTVTVLRLVEEACQ